MKPESSAASWLEFFTSAGINVQYAEHYAVTFSKNQIQLDMLPEINKDYLNDMGINLLGHVIAILRHAKLVYADEIKKSELSAAKKPLPTTNSTKSVVKEASNSKVPTPKTTKGNEKPTPSVVKRKSDPPAADEPQMKVRKNLCDSSDDIAIPKVKPNTVAKPVSNAPDAKVTNESVVNGNARKGVFKRLGVEVSQTHVDVYPQPQPNVNNGVFSRLGEKSDIAPLLALKTPIPLELSSKSLAKKSIIRTRLDKPKQRDYPLPQAYMDREEPERRLTPKLTGNRTSNSDYRDIRARLGDSFSKVTSQRPGGTKKVSFGSVSQKLIPRANISSNNSFPSKQLSGPFTLPTSRFIPNGKPTGVFSRLDIA